MDKDVVTVKNQKQGFFAKMSNSFSGIVVGILLLIGGIGLLWWNEHNNVKNIKNVKELRDQIIDVSSSKVDSKYDGKLIATNGVLTYNDDTLTDTEFNVSVKAPAFCREIEIYEWVEESETKDDETIYTYKKEWKSEIIDSNDFNSPKGHENPTEDMIKYSPERFVTDEDLKVGEYTLGDNFKAELESDKSVPIPEDVKLPEGYKVNNKYITNSENVDEPQIGDIRIYFNKADYKEISVMGKQDGDTIVEYTTKNNTVISKLVKGTKNGTSMINDIESANNMMKWIFRILGTLLIVIGVSSILGPITTLIGYIPFLGNIVNSMIGVVSFLIGLSIALIVIAISWFAARPIVAIISLVVVAALIVGLVFYVKNNKKTTQTVEQK